MRRGNRRANELQALLRPTITPAHAAALKAYERGDHEAALKLLESVPPGAPSHILARGMIVELLIALGRWSDAERVAAQVVKLGTATAVLQPPRFITTLRNHAEAVAVQGREAEACGLFLCRSETSKTIRRGGWRSVGPLDTVV